MMRWPEAAAGVLAAALLLTGCYGSKVMRQPVTVDETARSVEAVRQQQVLLEKRLAALERKVEEQTDLLRSVRAEADAQGDDLGRRLSSIDVKLRDALSARSGYSGGTPPIWSAAPPAAGKPPTPSVTAPHSGETADSAQVVPEPGPVLDTKRIYDQAYLDLNRGNYSLATQEFRDFLRRSPDSDLADNAQYWIGECFYAQRDYRQAVTEFLQVAEKYSHGDKVPAALLKIGYSFLQMEDRASARRYLNQVIERYPNSDEAGMARNKLRSAG